MRTSSAGAKDEDKQNKADDSSWTSKELQAYATSDGKSTSDIAEKSDRVDLSNALQNKAEHGADEAEREAAHGINPLMDNGRVPSKAEYLQARVFGAGGATKDVYAEKDFSTLRQVVASGAVGLLKASHILQMESPLPCRQEIEMNSPNAYVSGNLEWESHAIAVVSYKWLTAAHPDPKMFHLKKLKHILKEMTRRTNKLSRDLSGKGDQTVEYLPHKQLVTFMDWVSLYQNVDPSRHTNRSANSLTLAQQRLFGDAMKSINIWYAHPSLYKIMLTEVEQVDEIPIVTYEESGWCQFERRVVELITPTWASFIAASFDSAMANADTWDQFHDNYYCAPLEGIARAIGEYEAEKGNPRLIPLTPEQFNLSVRVLNFTNGADKAFVMRKYEAVFAAVVCGAETISWRGHIFNCQFSFLMDFLEYTKMTLRCLELSYCGLRGEVPRSWLKDFQRLECLDLAENPDLDWFDKILNTKEGIEQFHRTMDEYEAQSTGGSFAETWELVQMDGAEERITTLLKTTVEEVD